VVLSGAGQFVDLPNNLVSNYTSITLEAWVTDNGSGAWARYVDFGNSTAGEGNAGTGTQTMFLTSPAGNGGLRGALTYTTSAGEQIVEFVPTPVTPACFDRSSGRSME
jgi:hypothetical protein